MEEDRPPLLERPIMYPPPPFIDECPPDLDRIDLDHEESYRRGPPGDFDHRMRRMPDTFPAIMNCPEFDIPLEGPPNFDHIIEGPPDYDPRLDEPSEFNHRMEGPPQFVLHMDGPPDFDPDMEGPPDFGHQLDEPTDFHDQLNDHAGFEEHHLQARMHQDGMMDDRFMRRGDRFGGDDMRRRTDFDAMPCGPPGPDFFPPPRNNFGPRCPPMMRGPRPDGFGPRMVRPLMFHPRGPHIPRMRGPRPGPPWMDGGMRQNFTPRFERPPGFRGPPGHFDDQRPHHRRFDDRRRFNKPEFNSEEPASADFGRAERRSRWGNSSPVEEELNEMANDVTQYDQQRGEEEFNPLANVCPAGEKVSCEQIGNTTPLRDEIGVDCQDIPDSDEAPQVEQKEIQNQPPELDEKPERD